MIEILTLVLELENLNSGFISTALVILFIWVFLLGRIIRLLRMEEVLLLTVPKLLHISLRYVLVDGTLYGRGNDWDKFLWSISSQNRLVVVLHRELSFGVLITSIWIQILHLWAIIALIQVIKRTLLLKVKCRLRIGQHLTLCLTSYDFLVPPGLTINKSFLRRKCLLSDSW